MPHFRLKRRPLGFAIGGLVIAIWLMASGSKTPAALAIQTIDGSDKIDTYRMCFNNGTLEPSDIQDGGDHVVILDFGVLPTCPEPYTCEYAKGGTAHIVKRSDSSFFKAADQCGAGGPLAGKALDCERALLKGHSVRSFPFSVAGTGIDYRIAKDELARFLGKGGHCMITSAEFVTLTTLPTIDTTGKAAAETLRSTGAWYRYDGDFPSESGIAAAIKQSTIGLAGTIRDSAYGFAKMASVATQDYLWSKGSNLLWMADLPVSSYFLLHSLGDPMNPSHRPAGLILDADGKTGIEKKVGETIRGSGTYSEILATVKKEIANGTLNDDWFSAFIERDLYFSIKKFNYSWVATKIDKKNYTLNLVITDIYNFDEFKTNYTRLGNVANNLALISQNSGGIIPYNVTITLKEKVTVDK